ncbi:hypothetical protein AGOR_G00047800 [Albula goreensis]|uniref:Uncharacterized protein n=1 Tax=Albula goreensis TaxID=1534307 RepID=A0A8T3DWM0_9TELE|nr:hypothetical protein AGOR_G00047800 [Albula goreensis]
MSGSVLAFQTQLASIMDVLVRNTVCEITRLYEDSYMNFQSIIAQHEEENASLKMKLQESEKALMLQSQRESRKNGAESQENLGHSDPLIKQEDPDVDMKIDMFCAVCGKTAESEPPFCDMCRRTVSFPAQSLEVEQSHRDGSVGKNIDFSEESDLMFDTEAFPRMFDSKPDLCYGVKDARGGSSVTPITPVVPMVIGSCPDVPVIPSASQSGPSRGGKRSSAKRPRPVPEVDNMAAEAKELVQAILARRPDGERVVKEYRAKGTLTDTTRRHLINILVAHMTETQGRIPPKNIRELYALGIVTLFPSLKDPFSKKRLRKFAVCSGLWCVAQYFSCYHGLLKFGKEHFYDVQNGTGYLAWRLKTVQRKTFHRSGGEQKPTVSRGPNFERHTQLGQQLQGEVCEEAILYMAECTDQEQVFLKMRETFQYRQQLVHDPQKTGTVLATFPRLLDTKGLVNQDFTLLFGLETSCKLLENWDSCFKTKVIKEAKSLTQSPDLHNLLKCAEYEPSSEQDVPEVLGWDSDMASVLLLVHLLPPPPGGRKSAKISAREAVDRVVQFYKNRMASRQCRGPTAAIFGGGGLSAGPDPELLRGLGPPPAPLPGQLLPGAFDELFKAHFVFGLSYDEALSSVYTFLQTTVYNIDVGSVKESPRVKELRARLLNNC